jgi:hypothetical protein
MMEISLLKPFRRQWNLNFLRGDKLMYERLNRAAGSALGYRITGKLDREEMRQITDELEGTIAAHGKVRVLIDLQTFPYGDLGALWEDLKFDVKHARDLDRIALLGGREIEKWATNIFAALTFTDCRVFEPEQLDRAWDWLTET